MSANPPPSQESGVSKPSTLPAHEREDDGVPARDEASVLANPSLATSAQPGGKDSSAVSSLKSRRRRKGRRHAAPAPSLASESHGSGFVVWEPTQSTPAPAVVEPLPADESQQRASPAPDKPAPETASTYDEVSRSRTPTSDQAVSTRSTAASTALTSPAPPSVIPTCIEPFQLPVLVKVSPLKDTTLKKHYMQDEIYDDHPATEGNVVATANSEATRRASREVTVWRRLSGAIEAASKASGMGIQRWAECRHPPAAIPEGNVQPPLKQRDGKVKCVTLASLLALVLAVATTLVAILLLRKKDDTTADGIEVCSTVDCVDHARILALSESQASTSCGNFGQYVCSGWTPRYRKLARTVLTEVTVDWMETLVRSSPRVHSPSSVLDRPLNMMRKCVEKTGSEDRAIDEFVKFVNGRTFSWPTEEWNDTEVVPSSRALSALVELAVLWGLPLWFRLDVFPNFLARPESVVAISPSVFPRIYVNLQQQIMQYDDVYPLYVQRFIDVIFSRRPAARAFENFIRGRANMQSHVFGNLSAAIEAQFITPRIFTVELLAETVKNLSAEDWTVALQHASKVMLTNDTLVFASNEHILAAMNSIFRSYSAREVWFHTVWWFVQAVGIVISNSISTELSIHPLGSAFLAIMCTVHVDEPYGALIAAGYRKLLAPAEQLKIRHIMEHIHDVAVEKVRSSSTHDLSTRSSLADLIGKTRGLIWPERGFDSLDALEQIYGPAENDTDTFFEEWLQSRQQRQRARNNAFNTDISSVFLADMKLITSYYAVTNVISVSPAVLAPPLFYTHGTSAMLYGGLGYIYAAEMFRAVNVLSHLLKGATIAAPTDITSHRAFWSTFWCYYPNNTYRLYPDLPAVDVAYTAYERFRDQDTDLPLKGLESYSPEQIFFITYCRSGCYVGYGGSPKNPVCSEMLKVSPPFANAFSCRTVPKCRYL
ncbi:hypothetical protein HPB49_006201 [Dermacentor silvarum]|uniref:Uncharacterized protein n=1 Tax=Dermacentor silvarum TaxID=543639 RepID=A0ACB8CDK7_DERSI|nr:neprilysin-like [Dermacentor silvarum]KAH7940820.1 hypothetical protein HPB49_006201 [Dermacentor silvarum]